MLKNQLHAHGLTILKEIPYLNHRLTYCMFMSLHMPPPQGLWGLIDKHETNSTNKIDTSDFTDFKGDKTCSCYPAVFTDVTNILSMIA